MFKSTCSLSSVVKKGEYFNWGEKKLLSRLAVLPSFFNSSTSSLWSKHSHSLKDLQWFIFSVTNSIIITGRSNCIKCYVNKSSTLKADTPMNWIKWKCFCRAVSLTKLKPLLSKFIKFPSAGKAKAIRHSSPDSVSDKCYQLMDYFFSHVNPSMCLVLWFLLPLKRHKLLLYFMAWKDTNG